MVFQESALFDSLTVEDNVAYRLIEETGKLTEEIHERVLEALRFVELEHTGSFFPSELSGGMRRRVAIARAIITQPEVLLYDSPTGGLDPVTSNTIIELVVKQRDVYETSSLLVTHRLQDAFTMASHYFDTRAEQDGPGAPGKRCDVHTSFLILRDGNIIFEGTRQSCCARSDPYIREYLSSGALPAYRPQQQCRPIQDPLRRCRPWRARLRTAARSASPAPALPASPITDFCMQATKPSMPVRAHTSAMERFQPCVHKEQLLDVDGQALR